jgi:hypothetical protein
MVVRANSAGSGIVQQFVTALGIASYISRSASAHRMFAGLIFANKRHAHCGNDHPCDWDPALARPPILDHNEGTAIEDFLGDTESGSEGGLGIGRRNLTLHLDHKVSAGRPNRNLVNVA